MVLLLPYLLSILACTALSPTAGSVSAKKLESNHVQALRRHAADKLSKKNLSTASRDVNSGGGVQNFTFSNPAASGKCLLWPVSQSFGNLGGHANYWVGSVLRRWKHHTGRRLGYRAQLGGVIADQRERGRDPKGRPVVNPAVPFQR